MFDSSFRRGRARTLRQFLGADAAHAPAFSYIEYPGTSEKERGAVR